MPPHEGYGPAINLFSRCFVDSTLKPCLFQKWSHRICKYMLALYLLFHVTAVVCGYLLRLADFTGT